MFVFCIHGSLEADISPKMPFEVSFSCHDNDEIESHNHNKYPLLYKEAEISTSSLDKFLECQKYYILLVTCALVIYLICTSSALGPAALGLRAYISGKSLVPMLQLLHTPVVSGYVMQT